MADVALLRRLVSGIEHDHDHAATPHEVQAIAGSKVHPHLRDFAFDGLPVSQASGLCLAKASCDPNLSTLVLQSIEPGYELFGLENSEPARTVANWIQPVKPPRRSWCGLTFELTRPASQGRVLSEGLGGATTLGEASSRW